MHWSLPSASRRDHSSILYPTGHHLANTWTRDWGNNITRSTTSQEALIETRQRTNPRSYMTEFPKAVPNGRQAAGLFGNLKRGFYKGERFSRTMIASRRSHV